MFDVKSYIDEHPGGAFVMKVCVGKDVGRYLDGSYIIEKNGTCQKPHLHTNYALGIVKKLAIAKLQKSNYIRPAKGKTVDDRENDRWQITKAHKRSDNTATYDFTNDAFLVKQFFSGVAETGKHFIVTSKVSNVGRYYTICNFYSQALYGKF